MTDTLHEHLCTFTIISCRVLIRMRNVSDKSCRENQNTILCSLTFLFKSRAVYETIWANVVERDRPQMTKGACASRSE